MKKLLIKGLFLLFPFIVIISFFALIDPMRIFFKYDNPMMIGEVTMNDRKYQAVYLQDKKNIYDSFIFGSSRSKALLTNIWKNYINSYKIFHVGVFDETIFGISKKIEYLDRLGYRLKNVIILIDSRILSRPINPDVHVFREYYKVSGEPIGEYYKYFFIAFIKPEFFKEYISYKITNKTNKNLIDYIWTKNIKYIKETGDHLYLEYEIPIKKDSLEYYLKNRTIFYDRDYATNYIPIAVINKESEAYLKNIFQVLKKHNTKYKIVITPNYDMKKIHENDLKILIAIFGSSNVSDFSGINNITKNIGNYYEEKHFKPYIADSLMKTIYIKNNE